MADPKSHREAQANAERQLALIRQRIAETELLIDLSRQAQGIVANNWQTTVHAAPAGFENIEEQMRRRAEMQQRLNDLVAYGNQLDAEGRAIKESLRSPYEQLIDSQRRLQELLDKGAIGAETFGQAMQRATFVAADAYMDLASQIGGALQTMFGKSKAAAIGSAVINTAQAVTRTLAQYGGTPWGFAAAAAAAASGAAQLATIRSTNMGSGGSVRRPSVGGGSMSSPQETATGGGAPTTVYVKGLDRLSISQDQIRGLIEDMNAAIKDGYRLVIT